MSQTSNRKVKEKKKERFFLSLRKVKEFLQNFSSFKSKTISVKIEENFKNKYEKHRIDSLNGFSCSVSKKRTEEDL